MESGRLGGIKRKYVTKDEVNDQETDDNTPIVWRRPKRKPINAEQFGRMQVPLVTDTFIIGQTRLTRPLASKKEITLNSSLGYRNPLLESGVESRIRQKLGMGQTTEPITPQTGQFPDILVCSICFFPFSDPVTSDPCTHVYCKSCILKWVRSKPESDSHPQLQSQGSQFHSCPICRCEINQIRHAYEVQDRLKSWNGSCSLQSTMNLPGQENTDSCNWSGNGLDYAIHVRKGCFTEKIGKRFGSELKLGKRSSVANLPEPELSREHPSITKTLPKPKRSRDSTFENPGTQTGSPSSLNFGLSLGNALWSFKQKQINISDDDSIEEIDPNAFTTAHNKPLHQTK